MRLDKMLFALIVLGNLAGCYPPSQSSYNQTVWEQPQPVHFFYGRLVAIRPAQIAYDAPAGFGLRARWSPWLAGISASGSGASGGIGATAAGVGVFFEASVPNVQALEYTVMLDRGSNPPDPYLDPREPTAPIIVVQNVYPFETAPQLNDHVAVRVVGKSARVIAGALPSDVEKRLAAGPMPIPLPCPPSVTGCSPYGGSGTAVASAAPLPQNLPPCTICNRTSTTIKPYGY